MKQTSRTLIWIIAALCLFAVGRVGYYLYRQHHNTLIQNGNRPGLPDTK